MAVCFNIRGMQTARGFSRAERESPFSHNQYAPRAECDSEMSRSNRARSLTFSPTRTGLALKVTPLQKLSCLLAIVPPLHSRMLSPCTWWNVNGGRLLVPALDDLGAATRENNRSISWLIIATIGIATISRADYSSPSRFLFNC